MQKITAKRQVLDALNLINEALPMVFVVYN